MYRYGIGLTRPSPNDEMTFSLPFYLLIEKLNETISSFLYIYIFLKKSKLEMSKQIVFPLKQKLSPVSNKFGDWAI